MATIYLVIKIVQLQISLPTHYSTH